MNLSFPYQVDYNDHFETPSQAYHDILPLLDSVSPYSSTISSNKNTKNTTTTADGNIAKNSNNIHYNIRKNHILYDPYYCNGATKKLLNQLGFKKVQHEKRDFYQDVTNGTIPLHDTFITNPPYSADHKVKCINFAVKQLRQNQPVNHKPTNSNDPSLSRPKPFFLLMPNYIATKEYFQSAILQPNNENKSFEIFYVIPPKHSPYEYHHPENTGKDTPPFESIWFCGIPTQYIQKAKDAFRQVHGIDSVGISTHDSRSATDSSNSNILNHRTTPLLVSTMEELKQLKAIPTIKRRNPKQRRKEKLRLQGSGCNSNNNPTATNQVGSSGSQSDKHAKHIRNLPSKRSLSSDPTTCETVVNESMSKMTKKKKSMYRNETGARKKKRF